MQNRGKLWIIPNEEEILQEAFQRNVQEGRSHTHRIQEFSDIYHLGFQFKEEDYQTAPCEIAMLGHMVVKSEEEVSLIVCYLPEKITDRQYNWLYQNSDMLGKYIQINAYSLETANEDGICWKKVHGIEEIMKEARKKNLSSMKGKGM